jgi:hypothetical protein
VSAAAALLLARDASIQVLAARAIEGAESSVRQGGAMNAATTALTENDL